MDISIYGRNSNPKLRYQIIGGILDFKIFLGESPNDVINQFHEYLGKYAM